MCWSMSFLQGPYSNATSSTIRTESPLETDHIFDRTFWFKYTQARASFSDPIPISILSLSSRSDYDEIRSGLEKLALAPCRWFKGLTLFLTLFLNFCFSGLTMDTRLRLVGWRNGKQILTRTLVPSPVCEQIQCVCLEAPSNRNQKWKKSLTLR